MNGSKFPALLVIGILVLSTTFAFGNVSATRFSPANTGGKNTTETTDPTIPSSLNVSAAVSGTAVSWASDLSNGYEYVLLASGTPTEYTGVSLAVFNSTAEIASLGLLGTVGYGFPTYYAIEGQVLFDQQNQLVYVGLSVEYINPGWPPGGVYAVNGTVITSLENSTSVSTMTIDSSNGYLYVSEPKGIEVISGYSVLRIIPLYAGPTQLVYDSKNGLVYTNSEYPTSPYNEAMIMLSGTAVVGNLTYAPQHLYLDSANGLVYGGGFVFNGTSMVAEFRTGNFIPGPFLFAASGLAYEYLTGNIDNPGWVIDVIDGVDIVGNMTLATPVFAWAINPQSGFLYVSLRNSTSIISPPSSVLIANGTTIVRNAPVGSGGVIQWLYDSSDAYVYGYYNDTQARMLVFVGSSMVSNLANLPLYPVPASLMDIAWSSSDGGLIYLFNAPSPQLTNGTLLFAVEGGGMKEILLARAGSLLSAAMQATSENAFVDQVNNNIFISIGHTYYGVYMLSPETTSVEVTTTTSSTVGSTIRATSTSGASSSSSQIATTTQSATSIGTSETNGASGGIPEFPYQILAASVLTLSLVVSYLLIRLKQKLSGLQ